jgi:hypothetical protein
VTRRGRGDGGQAAVELALVLPLVALLALLLLQVGLVVRDQVLVVHAAREAAREAAVDDDLGVVKQVVEDTSGLDGERLDVEVAGRSGPGSRVRATVRYTSRTDVPLVGRLVGDVHLSGTAAMRVET